jgi:hypothetical protein
MPYPVLGTGAVCQRPYTVSITYITLVGDIPTSNYRWTGDERTTPIRSWDLDYPAITEAEAAELETFFVDTAIGRFVDFPFTDPEGVEWPSVRFDQDDLVISYVAPGHFSTKVRLIEIKL